MSVKGKCIMGMAIRRKSEDLLLVHFTGILKDSDQEEYERIGRLEIDRSRKIKIFVNATGFSGWGKGGDWGDLRFMYEYDPYIEKIAVMAEDKWKDQMLEYLRAGKRQALVRFFDPLHAQEARDWIHTDGP
jgi:hypothetical protein